PPLLTLTAFMALVSACPGALIVDDTWADGTRTNQNMPTDSAWFTSQPALMSAATGRMSVTNRPDNSSCNFYTYFTTNGSVVQLANVGDALTAEISFTVVGMPT